MWVARRVGVSPAREGLGFGVQDSDNLDELAALLNHSRDLGVANLKQVASEEHARHGLSYDDCLTYSCDHLHFTLGQRELAGLGLFERLLAGTKPGPGDLRRVPVNTASTFASAEDRHRNQQSFKPTP